jgi:hypothetical protein
MFNKIHYHTHKSRSKAEQEAIDTMKEHFLHTSRAVFDDPFTMIRWCNQLQFLGAGQQETSMLSPGQRLAKMKRTLFNFVIQASPFLCVRYYRQ